MRNLIAAAGVLFAVITPSQAAEGFDGLWALSKMECRHTDEADSRTMIDLSKPIGGNPAPMVDQHENHCRIDRKTAAGDGLTLAVTCFEFWDKFQEQHRTAQGSLQAGARNERHHQDRRPDVLPLQNA